MAEKKKKINKKKKKNVVKNKGNSAKKTPIKTNEKENQVTNEVKSTKTRAKQVAASKKPNSVTNKKKPSISKESNVMEKSEESVNNSAKKSKKNLKKIELAVTSKQETSKQKDRKKLRDKKHTSKKKRVSKDKIKGKEIKKNAKKEKNVKTKKLKKRNPFAKLIEKLKRKNKIDKQEKKAAKEKLISSKKEKKQAKLIKKETKKNKNKTKEKKKKNSNKKQRAGFKKIGAFFKKVGNKAKETPKKVVGIVKKGASHLRFKSIKKKNQKTTELKLKEKNNSIDKNNIEAAISNEELKKKNKKKRKCIRRLICLSILCLGLAILLMIPYGLGTYNSEASNRVLDVPKFVKLKEECCAYNATFSTLRSAWSLQKDLEEMIKKYEVLDCDGKTYYYNPKENYTITEYGIHKGIIFNEVYIYYGSGNSCDIDTKFKKLELLAERFTIEDATKDGNYVMDGDKIYNKEAYDKFMASVKKKTPSTLRIVTSTKDGDVLITDLDYLKGGKYRVSYDGTRDRNSKNHNSIIAYKFDHLKVYKNKLYVYNGDKLKIKKAKKYETYYLLTLPKE